MSDLNTGTFLVATTRLVDPNFRRTVVYLVVHGVEGSLGFVINRPLAIPLGELWTDCPATLSQTLIAAEGGPVERNKGLLVHRDPAVTESAAMGAGLWVGGSLDALVGRWADGPDRLGPRLFLGHSGWAPGQLEQEVADGAWTVRPGSLDQLFDREAGEDLWERLAKRAGTLRKPSLN